MCLVSLRSSEANDVLVSEVKGNTEENWWNLKLDMKHSDSQLKDSELEIGLPTRQALNDVKNSGMQKQCYLGIRTFFTETLTCMQELLALRNQLIEALTCLHPAEKAKITSVEKIRKVGDSLPCIKPEELTVLTDEWRIYAETDIPEERWLSC